MPEKHIRAVKTLYKYGVIFLKKTAKYLGLFLLVTVIAASLLVWTSGDSKIAATKDLRIVNDITGLNPIRVGRVIRPSSLEEIVTAIKSSTGPISIGGGRFSQGGQIAYPDSLHFDMRSFSKVVSFNIEKKEITVQAGITWREIQEYIDPHNLAIKIMQTYSNFTVGGSLSVNVHGRYIGEGPVVHTVKSIQLVMADSSVVAASPTVNRNLFYGAIGGYGGLGIITEATLQLADNEKVERRVTAMKISEYKEHFFKNVREDKDVVFHNADIYPPDYEVILDVSWYRTDKPLTNEDRLIPVDDDYFWGPFFAEMVADSGFGKWLRQHILDPVYYIPNRVVWRNWEASYDVKEIEPEDREEATYVLREYFVPVECFDLFVPVMKDIFLRNDVNILNVSIRHAKADPGTLLSWAKGEVFAFVVYYRQGTTPEAKAGVAKWSREMIDAVIKVGGSYYLPYQIYASKQQFHAVYPNAKQYFRLKKKVDPNNRFRNQLWKQHYPANASSLEVRKQQIKNYFRNEEQTYLTIPEWYLVFNPREYTEYLESGGNPSDFPFFASIDEYWTLYDHVSAISEANHVDNSEYMTMLNVIGFSTTVEYMLKGAYENTLGRFTRWTAGGVDTAEDRIIRKAHQAYSKLIYSKAWYEFKFWLWVKKIWGDTDFFGKDFIRKTERKLFFTLEFGFKSLYAQLIEFGAKTAYEQSDGQIYLTVKLPPTRQPAMPARVNVISRENDKLLISVPRWGGFTETVPKLAEVGIGFSDISGNYIIAASVITEKGNPSSIPVGDTLFTSRVVSNPALERKVLIVRVQDLKQFLISLKRSKYVLEHLYDF